MDRSYGWGRSNQPRWRARRLSCQRLFTSSFVNPLRRCSSTGAQAALLINYTNGDNHGVLTVTLKRDATPPAIMSENATSYTVDQTVDITCEASDAMSGLASSDCPGASGQAYTIGLGTTTLDASATDNAGTGGSCVVGWPFITGEVVVVDGGRLLGG